MLMICPMLYRMANLVTWWLKSRDRVPSRDTIQPMAQQIPKPMSLFLREHLMPVFSPKGP